MSEKFLVNSSGPPINTPLISVGEYIWNELGKLNGQQVLIIDSMTDQKLTVKELITKSNSIANSLIERGINKTDIIMTFAENSIELVVTIIASILLGVTIYPVSPIANIYEMQTLFETLDSITIFASKTKTQIIEEVVNRSKTNQKQINVKNMIVLNAIHDNCQSFKDLQKENFNKSLNRIPYFEVNPKEDTFRLIDEENGKTYDFSSLEFVNTSGAAIDRNAVKKLIEKYGLKFQEGYGMTEYGTLTYFFDCIPEDDEYVPGSLGRPVANTQMKVIDINTGQSLGPNIDGEICVRGPKMFLGYYNNKTATDEAIDSDGWLHTGDIGHYDEENRFYITDRLKELIKFGTKQVSPTELELFLLTHPSVAEVVVVGVKHKTDTQWPRAYIKIKPGDCVTEEELKKYVSDNLSAAKELRAGVVFLDRIPRTTIGKVDRRYFKQLVANEVIDN